MEKKKRSFRIEWKSGILLGCRSRHVEAMPHRLGLDDGVGCGSGCQRDSWTRTENLNYSLPSFCLLHLFTLPCYFFVLRMRVKKLGSFPFSFILHRCVYMCVCVLAHLCVRECTCVCVCDLLLLFFVLMTIVYHNFLSWFRHFFFRFFFHLWNSPFFSEYVFSFS